MVWELLLQNTDLTKLFLSLVTYSNKPEWTPQHHLRQPQFTFVPPCFLYFSITVWYGYAPALSDYEKPYLLYES